MTHEPAVNFRVELTADANSDLLALAGYVADRHTIAQAEYVVSKIEVVVEKLAVYPERGVYPPELLALGIKDFRPVLFKPYRVIYRLLDRRVVVHLIADGRRDLQALLNERLLSQP